MTGRICHECYGQNLAKKNRAIFGNKYPQETAGKSADPRYHFADAMIYEALTKYYTSRIGEAQGEVRKVAAMWNATLLKSVGEVTRHCRLVWRAVYFRLVGFRLLHMSIHMPRTSVISTIAITNSGRVNVILPPANFEFQVHP